MQVQDALKIFNNYLTEVERKEILEYQTIYYFNVQERQKWKGKES